MVSNEPYYFAEDSRSSNDAEKAWCAVVVVADPTMRSKRTMVSLQHNEALASRLSLSLSSLFRSVCWTLQLVEFRLYRESEEGRSMLLRVFGGPSR